MLRNLTHAVFLANLHGLILAQRTTLCLQFKKLTLNLTTHFTLVDTGALEATNKLRLATNKVTLNQRNDNAFAINLRLLSIFLRKWSNGQLCDQRLEVPW